MDTKFTIITASYNYENFIKETIESVLAQSYPNWEMIIIDDGSKDNSLSVINSYCKKDERIKLYTHKNNQNKGLIETIKLGINKAQTDWLVFLESDDTITPDYLEKKLNVIQNNPEVKFIFNSINLFGSQDRIKTYDGYFSYCKKLLSENQYPKNQLKCFKKTNLVPTFSCVALKKELFENIDFNSPIQAIVDYYIWMQIAKKTSFYYLDEKLTNWRMHDSYITINKNNDFQKAKFKFKKNLFLNQYKTFGILSNIYIYIGYAFMFVNAIRRKIIRTSKKEKSITLFGKRIALRDKK